MEQRLKKQRNRLFLKVSLILFAVWLVVSATYCVIRFYSEKSDVQSRELEFLSNVKQEVSNVVYRVDAVGFAFLGSANLFDNNGKLDNQLIITDQKYNRVLLNTANTIGVEFGVRDGVDNSVTLYGFIDYFKVHGKLDPAELKEIKSYLTKERSDGKRYEIVCSKFHVNDFEFIPLELKLALVDSDEMWSVSDKIVKTYSLKVNEMMGVDIFNSNDMKRNVIPKSFILDAAYNRDYISDLPKGNKSQAVSEVSESLFNYIFYASDYLTYNDIVNDESDGYTFENQICSIQYAREINLWENCKTDFIIGVSVIFGFFLIIALILCFMIWKMVKAQIIQEQKRADLTGALAHDIKTPLFVISGYAYSLKEDIDEDERDSYLDKIIAQTDGINELVRKMLNLSKLDSYTMTLNRSDFDLSELAREITGDYRSLPEGKTLTLDCSGDNQVNADRELISTALSNLIENAVKYSLPESEIKIEIKGSGVSVSNPSEALTKAELKQLWEPYFRKDKSRRRNGNGLGLSIVKSIMELHGARYEIKQKGDVFTISFEL